MINIVAALPVEAKPIIQHFRLQKIQGNHSFTIFSNGDVELIVSGVGAIAAATATGYLAARRGHQQVVAWLNIGIVGSLSRSVGDAVLAHSVTDVTNGQRYYPSLIFAPMCDTASVVTVPKPETSYDGESVFDMEASGFYAAATRFNSNELIHCLKVVSDNQHNSVSNISEPLVKALITEQMEKIDQLVNEMRALIEKLGENAQATEDYRVIAKHFHFTVSQQLTLKSHINHWYALTNHVLLSELIIENYRNAKALLAELQRRLNTMPLSYIPTVRDNS